MYLNSQIWIEYRNCSQSWDSATGFFWFPPLDCVYVNANHFLLNLGHLMSMLESGSGSRLR